MPRSPNGALVDITFIAACRSIPPRQYLWQSQGQIRISGFHHSGGLLLDFAIPVPIPDEAPVRMAVFRGPLMVSCLDNVLSSWFLRPESSRGGWCVLLAGSRLLRTSPRCPSP